MLRYLLEKEFKQFFRNSFLPKMVIMLPLVAMLLFPLLASFEIKNINLSVVDHDKSGPSARLVEKMRSSGYFRLTNVANTYSEALESVENNVADMLVEIPAGFGTQLETARPVKVLIATNAVNGVKGGLGSSYIMTILKNFSADIVPQWQPLPEVQNRASFDIIPRYWFNPVLEYRVFMIPALMIMILAIISGFIPAMNIVGEKESGTIEQMNVTPVSRFHFILSKLIPHWVVGFVSLSIAILVTRWIYGFKPVGSIATVYLFASLFMLAFSGFGLVISNYAKTMQQALFMILFFMLTFIFLSGFFTPVNNMPQWGQIVSNLTPFKYIVQVFRLVYLKGNGFLDMIPHFLALCAFALFFNGWAVLSYRKRS
jgi:ABC-2 type transport system permease protein